MKKAKEDLRSEPSSPEDAPDKKKTCIADGVRAIREVCEEEVVDISECLNGVLDQNDVSDNLLYDANIEFAIATKKHAEMLLETPVAKRVRRAEALARHLSTRTSTQELLR